MTTNLILNIQDSEAHNLLQKVELGWDSIKMTITNDHKQADSTRAFWEAANPRFAVGILLKVNHPFYLGIR